MKKRPADALPLMWMELAAASWETIGHRTLMMAQGRCSPAEYSRMVREKLAASQRTAEMLMRAKPVTDWGTLMAPWHTKATANARRLRRR
jgi:hypothetical protein